MIINVSLYFNSKTINLIYQNLIFINHINTYTVGVEYNSDESIIHKPIAYNILVRVIL